MKLQAEWVAACIRFLPDFPITLIAYLPAYASAMLPLPNLNFNLYNYSFSTPDGSRFREQAKKHNRLVFSWSDNEEEWMAAGIRNEMDAVITDDPNRFLELCDQWSSQEVREKASRTTVKQATLWVIINALNSFGGLISWLVLGSAESRVKKVLAF